MNDTDVLLGSAEAARRLGVHRAFIEREVRAGRLVPVHRGTGVRGAMLFRSIDIDALAVSRERAAVATSPRHRADIDH